MSSMKNLGKPSWLKKEGQWQSSELSAQVVGGYHQNNEPQGYDLDLKPSRKLSSRRLPLCVLSGADWITPAPSLLRNGLRI